MDRHETRRPSWRDDEFEPEYEAFTGHHRSFADRVERFLMQLITLGLVALVLVQTLQINGQFRRWSSLVEALEGVPWTEVTSWYGVASPRSGSDLAEASAVPATGQAGQPAVTIALINRREATQARLLIDGQSAGDFGHGRLTAVVRSGQELVLDGSQVSDELQFRVVGASGLASPALGSSFSTQGDRRSLGRVRLAD